MSFSAGTIPVLGVSEEGLPRAWEKAICKLSEWGADAPTQYDRPGDPPSKDAMMIIEINHPLAEPRIHRFFPGGPADLEEYCMEVMEGVKDHWCRDPKDPNDKRWSYTYHGRMCSAFGVNQIEGMVKKLSKQPFTRQAQFTTWMPASDPDDYDPPCLQRGWARILRNVKDDIERTGKRKPKTISPATAFFDTILSGKPFMVNGIDYRPARARRAKKS